jgi:transposase InsO family protein
MSHDDATAMRVRWARLRFSIIGPLLASPPAPGELADRLRELAHRSYQNPSTKLTIRFGASTIERWYYDAKDEADPVRALERKVPAHAGTHPAVSAALALAIHTLYRQHPSWSFQLHHDNLAVLAKQDASLGVMPGYATVRRFMRDQGLLRQRRRRPRFGDPATVSDSSGGDFVLREKRAFEVSHVHQLWHLDFHVGSRKVLTASGQWRTPMLLGILDDHSRLCCHLQWYLEETADALIHGLSQAIAKRGRPRALMTDNGAAMVAAETVEGLERLGIVHHTTLPYTPEQNAKQERFWGQVEGRLMAMLEGEPELTLGLLNDATQAWVEHEYHRNKHDEIGEPPIERALRGPSLVRGSPTSDEMRRAFRTQTTRSIRRSDGTFTVGGVRFEVPTRYRTLLRLTVRVARWDLSTVDLVDPRSGAHLCTALPLDRHKNADRGRRTLPVGQRPEHDTPSPPPSGIAPKLRALMADYAATGLPPAYLAHPARDESSSQAPPLAIALDSEQEEDPS